MRRRRTNPLILIATVIALAIGAWFSSDDQPAPASAPAPASVPSRTATTAPAPEAPQIEAPQVEAPAATEEDPLAAFVPDEAERAGLVKTLALIEQGGPFPHRQDGAVFQNRERRLPQQPRGYYHEYTVRTPGASNRGARRVVRGDGGELYYTRDHYRSFIRIDSQ